LPIKIDFLYLARSPGYNMSRMAAKSVKGTAAQRSWIELRKSCGNFIEELPKKSS
jgi:hypothetical protein